MSDLSHWKFATDFTGEEAAALAVGLDPAQPNYVRTFSKPIYERMERHFEAAKRLHLEEDVQQWERPPLLPQSDVFESVELQLWAGSQEEDDGAFFSKWLLDDKLSGFEAQRFTRKEVARWFSAVGVQSSYSFDSNQIDAKSKLEKPLGTTERNTLLTIIAVLAKEAKISIDPPGKSAGYIAGLTDAFGASVSKRAIEDHLKKIPDALATRMK
ncbi:MAG: hypothetical protein V4858_27035 [Pseudomonadota bacterium]